MISIVLLCAFFSNQDTDSYGYLMKHLSDLELEMNAVERIEHYATLPTEDLKGMTIHFPYMYLQGGSAK